MKLEGKVNGKVIYNEESINANIYTMRLETGDYINIKVENKRADKIDLNIGDAVSVTIAKEV
jgi:translation initiation factor IF-1